MTKYQNYSEFLKEFFDIKTSFEEFKLTNKITFVCKSNEHVNTLSIDSFGNKKSKYKDSSLFCEECKKECENGKKLDFYKQYIKERLGHTIIDINSSTRNVMYICGNCGSKNKTCIQNLNKKLRQNIVQNVKMSKIEGLTMI